MFHFVIMCVKRARSALQPLHVVVIGRLLVIWDLSVCLTGPDSVSESTGGSRERR